MAVSGYARSVRYSGEGRLTCMSIVSPRLVTPTQFETYDDSLDRRVNLLWAQQDGTHAKACDKL